MTITDVFGKLGYGAVKAVTIPVFSWNLLGVLKEVGDIILTVERMMQDGKIDASERRELAVKAITIALGHFGIGLSTEQIGALVDAIVAVLNATGVMKKKQK